MSSSYKCVVLLTRKTHFCNFRAMFVIFVTHLCELVTPFRGAVVGMNLAWGGHTCALAPQSHSIVLKTKITHNIKKDKHEIANSCVFAYAH